ncbi:alpha-ribazole phosphatase [Bacilli bacterium PM5-3]|nr:alpha-ribazole phosphatase [Bacilli bacterium PM5-3]MDH6604325.1 alpha-ribazole phosphatase [Bacilli bacterium PM5-9]
MKIYFVRHGRTQGNIDQIYNGTIDEVLADIGKEDLSEKKSIYKNLKFDYIYCSPLTRCKQTFDILFPDDQVDEYREDLIEMDFGDWAGTKYEKKFTELQEQGYTWNDYVDPENGETYESLFSRTTNFLKEVISKHKNDENILVVCHGLVIAAIMKKHFIQDEIMYYLSPKNGLGYIVDTDENKAERIVFEK